MPHRANGANDPGQLIIQSAFISQRLPCIAVYSHLIGRQQHTGRSDRPSIFARLGNVISKEQLYPFNDLSQTGECFC